MVPPVLLINFFVKWKILPYRNLTWNKILKYFVEIDSTCRDWPNFNFSCHSAKCTKSETKIYLSETFLCSGSPYPAALNAHPLKCYFCLSQDWWNLLNWGLLQRWSLKGSNLNVIDGGIFLHKIVWDKRRTSQQIAANSCEYEIKTIF